MYMYVSETAHNLRDWSGNFHVSNILQPLSYPEPSVMRFLPGTPEMERRCVAGPIYQSMTEQSKILMAEKASCQERLGWPRVIHLSSFTPFLRPLLCVCTCCSLKAGHPASFHFLRVFSCCHGSWFLPPLWSPSVPLEALPVSVPSWPIQMSREWPSVLMNIYFLQLLSCPLDRGNHSLPLNLLSIYLIPETVLDAINL